MTAAWLFWRLGGYSDIRTEHIARLPRCHMPGAAGGEFILKHRTMLFTGVLPRGTNVNDRAGAHVRTRARSAAAADERYGAHAHARAHRVLLEVFHDRSATPFPRSRCDMSTRRRCAAFDGAFSLCYTFFPNLLIVRRGVICSGVARTALVYAPRYCVRLALPYLCTFDGVARAERRLSGGCPGVTYHFGNVLLLLNSVPTIRCLLCAPSLVLPTLPTETSLPAFR